jgi:hypothetical protein
LGVQLLLFVAQVGVDFVGVMLLEGLLVKLLYCGIGLLPLLEGLELGLGGINDPRAGFDGESVYLAVQLLDLLLPGCIGLFQMMKFSC